MTSRLLIGCGYLGRHIASLWRGEGLFATTRSLARADELRQGGLEPVVCDVLDPESLRHLLAVDTVVHGVGFDRTVGRSFREVYLDGLGNVLAALPPPRRFVYISSTGVYGQCHGEEVDEDAVTEPVEESGRVLLEAERLLHQRYPDAVILRFAGIYGPGRLLRRQALEAGEPLVGDPEKWLNLIHVTDGAAAVVAAAERARAGAVYNVSDGCPVRRRDFYTLVAQALAAPPPRFVPPAAGAPLPSHERANRRIVARRCRDELGVRLRYPSYREGVPASV